MRTALHSLALLSLSPSLALAWGHGSRVFPVYGGHSVVQPGITATVTTTEVSTVTVEQTSWSVIYIPTTVTVHTGCSASEDSSVSGIPISSHSSHGPWANATSTDVPCTHGWPTSTALTAPGNFSTSLGWNHTMSASRPTLTGTAGTTIESVDPIGTSSAPWGNSTRSSAIEEDSTSFLTLTVTSSTVVTVNATSTSGHFGPTAPSSGYGTGTGLPGSNSTAVPTSYQPSLTYQTTEISSTAAHLPINGTSISTTATEDPIFTTIPSQTSSTSIWTNTTLTSNGGSNTTLPTSTVGGPNNGGDHYGSYTYNIPSPSSATLSSTTSPTGTEAITSIESVDPIGGTSSTTAAAASSSATTFLTASRPASSSSSSTGSVGGTDSTTTHADVVTTATTKTAGGGGGGYGYGGGYY